MYCVKHVHRASAAWMSVFSSRSRFRPATAHCNDPPGPSVHVRATSSTTNWPVKPVAPNTMIWYGLLLDVVSVAIVSVIRVRCDTDEVRATAAAPLVSLYTVFSISVKYCRRGLEAQVVLQINWYTKYKSNCLWVKIPETVTLWSSRERHLVLERWYYHNSTAV